MITFKLRTSKGRTESRTSNRDENCWHFFLLKTKNTLLKKYFWSDNLETEKLETENMKTHQVKKKEKENNSQNGIPSSCKPWKCKKKNLDVENLQVVTQIVDFEVENGIHDWKSSTGHSVKRDSKWYETKWVKIKTVKAVWFCSTLSGFSAPRSLAVVFLFYYYFFF